MREIRLPCRIRVQQFRKRLPGDAEPLGGPGHGKAQRFQALAPNDAGVQPLRTRYEVATFEESIEYSRQLAAASDRLELREIGRASRRVYTAAHELGHFTSTRHEPSVLRRDDSPHSREERYADHFARAFLTPARAVKLRFEELTAGHSHLTRRHVVLLADRFAVSREAMVRRLEELGLARRGTWDWFQSHGGITDRQAEQVLGTSHHRADDPTSRTDHVPRRLALLVREAWKKAYYSEGQLARMLRLHRLEVRDLLEGAETERSEADDIVKLPR